MKEWKKAQKLGTPEVTKEDKKKWDDQGYEPPSLLPVRHTIAELPPLLFWNSTFQVRNQTCALRFTTPVGLADGKAKFACSKGGKELEGRISHASVRQLHL